MVFNVEFINDLHHIESYVLEVTWEGERFSGHLQVVDVAHVVVRNDYFLPVFSLVLCPNAVTSQVKISKNTCAGPSDLCLCTLCISLDDTMHV